MCLGGWKRKTVRRCYCEKSVGSLVFRRAICNVLGMEDTMKIAWKKAICYSGYREGQSPVTEIIPSKEEILEDLMLLKKEGFFLP